MRHSNRHFPRRFRCGEAVVGAIVLVSALAVFASAAEQPGAETTWKAGTSKAKITPEAPMYLAGFGGRSKAAESTLHDLWIKILALQSAKGDRGAIITSDVCGFSKATYERICAQLRQRCGLERSQILLTYSHTHTGPALDECLQDYCDWDTAARARIRDYTLKLEATIVDKVAEAFASLAPATLWAGEGTADFGVNRRNNREPEAPAILARGKKFKGPDDHTIPVLAVKGLDGKLRAAVFGYACHTSSLALLQWSGDYAGFAMIELEKSCPEAQAMFFQACGGDQGCMPRRTVELCQKCGQRLAAGVTEAIQRPMRPLASTLRTAQAFVDLDFEKVMTREDLQERAKDTKVYGRWARRMLGLLDAGVTFPKSHPYAIQAWRLGDQLWITMGGEPVVDYSLKFKQKYGPKSWVSGFAHELTSYIPSRRVWDEGGYEGGFLGEYGLPAMRWAPDVEDRITAGVQKVVAAVTGNAQ